MLKSRAETVRNMLFRFAEENARWDFLLIKCNASYLEGVVGSIGWPDATKVGNQASRDAWLIAYYSDHRSELQEHWLKRMRFCTHGVRSQDIAFLQDRIDVVMGRPQTYGTQFRRTVGGDRYVAGRIFERDRVNVRRAHMDLCDLDEHERIINMIEPFLHLCDPTDLEHDAEW